MEYYIAAIPQSESELVVMVSLLDAHDIPHYVQNRGFGSLYPGMQIPIYNLQRIMVPRCHAEETRALLASFRADAAIGQPPEPLHLKDRLRVLAEILLGGWAVPYRQRSFDPAGEDEADSQ